MKRSRIIALLVAASACSLLFGGCSGKGPGASGAEMFTLHCASCHPDGGNTVTQGKTLHAKDLQAHNIRTPGDIVEKMRNPGPGMPRFSQAVIPDGSAMGIAEYVLATFR